MRPMDRRRFLMASGAAAALGGSGCAALSPLGMVGGQVDPELTDLQFRTFRWFAETQNRQNGLTPDRWPTPSFCSVAAVGFALACWPIGVERGWMSREEARDRTLATIRFFHDAPRGRPPPASPATRASSTTSWT